MKELKLRPLNPEYEQAEYELGYFGIQPEGYRLRFRSKNFSEVQEAFRKGDMDRVVKLSVPPYLDT